MHCGETAARFLYSCYACISSAIYIPVIVILVIFLNSLQYGAPPLPTVVGCHPTQGSDILFADFVLLMIHETTVMILTLWVGVRRLRHSRSRLVTTLYKDGIFYFISLFLISAGNIVVLVAGPPEYVDLLNTFQRVLHSILSTRILLHVRQAARGDWANSIALSKLNFKNSGSTGASTSTSRPSCSTTLNI